MTDLEIIKKVQEQYRAEVKDLGRDDPETCVHWMMAHITRDIAVKLEFEEGYSETGRILFFVVRVGDFLFDGKDIYRRQ